MIAKQWLLCQARWSFTFMTKGFLEGYRTPLWEQSHTPTDTQPFKIAELNCWASNLNIIKQTQREALNLQTHQDKFADRPIPINHKKENQPEENSENWRLWARDIIEQEGHLPCMKSTWVGFLGPQILPNLCRVIHKWEPGAQPEHC